MTEPFRTKILKEAEEIINGPRAAAYGAPDVNLGTIAHLWNAYIARLATAQGDQVPDIGPMDVAAMMALLKIARIAGSPAYHHDSHVDVIGYMALGAEIGHAEQADWDAYNNERTNAVSAAMNEHPEHLVELPSKSFAGAPRPCGNSTSDPFDMRHVGSHFHAWLVPASPERSLYNADDCNVGR